MDLHRVGPPGEAELLGPDRDRAKHPAPALGPVLAAVHPPVAVPAPQDVDIVRPHAIHVDEGALARAVLMVLQGTDLHHRLDNHHSRSPP